MIKDYNFEDCENKYESFKRSELGDKLAKFQRLVKKLGIPVLIVIDGWESSGKGYVINDLIRELDPRLYKVSVFQDPTDDEKERPFLWRFWKKIPKKGNMAIFDRSFYFDVMDNPDISSDSLNRDIEDISSIERELYDDDTIVIKFFLHQKEETQKQRIDDLRMDRYRSFLITENDEKQYADYKKYLAHFERILGMSDFDYSPWHIIPTENLKSASKKILGMTLDLLQDGIDRYIGKQNGGIRYIRTYEAKEKPLESVDLTISLDQEEYDYEIKVLQKEAQELAYQLYTRKIPSVVVFEGMDASGKGGAIQRFTRLIDPRSYEVIPVSAPDETEREYHYMWRFFNSIPRSGRIAVFDRSWYGRVMVERIEGFASAREWDRAYDEINSMEKHLSNFGTMVIKFFIHIDKDDQLIRFEEREREAAKVYKITEEDWRNREKWDQYMEAANEMIVRTSTQFAQWIIVEGRDKRYARIKVLREFIKHAKKML